MNRHERISALFLAASELPLDEREAFLRKECGDDLELRDEVTSLLRQDCQWPFPGTALHAR